MVTLHYETRSWRTLWRARCACGGHLPCTIADAPREPKRPQLRPHWGGPERPGWDGPTQVQRTYHDDLRVRPYVDRPVAAADDEFRRNSGWWRA